MSTVHEFRADQSRLSGEEFGRPADMPDWEHRRWVRLLTSFYGVIRAICRAQTGPSSDPSLDTCELLRTPVGSAGRDAETPKRDLSQFEYAALPIAFALGIEDVERAVRLVQGSGDRRTALMGALGRSEDRQEKVIELLERGHVGKAKRLANCRQQSIQLECPDTIGAGGCGSDDNFVPASCGLRICPTCASSQKAEKVEKYTPVVEEMADPTLLSLTIENVSDMVAGKDAIVEAFKKLRNRGIPAAGETRRKNEDGEVVTKRWRWSGGGEPADLWKPKLLDAGQHELARSLQRRYVNYTYENITGTHQGRKIPFSELVRGGIYAIDIKAERAGSGFNIHLHAVVDMVYVPQAALSAVWEDITGSPVMDVRRIYPGEENVQDALMETVGYALKEPEFESVKEEVDYLEALENSRMVNPFGSLYGNVPDLDSHLVCSNCESIPRYWNYIGFVQDTIDNMGVVHGSSDHPPPGSGEPVQEYDKEPGVE